MTRRTRIILADASPLFSFAAIDRLDILFAAGFPIALTDYVEWEATRSGSVTALRIADWLSRNRPLVTVVETETGEEKIRKEKDGKADRRNNVGEITIFEAISNGYVGDGPFVFLHEDQKATGKVDPSFFGKYPVHQLTTYGYLVGLERSGVIPDADVVFNAIRGLGEVDLALDLEAFPRPGVKKILVDRPHRDADGQDTSWRP